MESLGEYLKKEREAKGVTIQEIADATRIHINFLEAIEQDDFDVFPAETFSRGFLRLYSKSVGLDPDEIIEKYNKYYREKHKAREKKLQQQVPSKNKSFGNIFPSLLIVVVAIVSMVGVFYLLKTKEHIKDKNIITKQKIAPNQVIQNAEKLLKSSTESSHVSLLKSKEKNIEESQSIDTANLITEIKKPQNPALNVEESILTIKTIEEVWLYVVIDDAVTRDVILKPGRTVSWKAKEKILFTTGNLKGIEVTLNGKPVKFPLTGGSVLRNYLIEIPKFTIE